MRGRRYIHPEWSFAFEVPEYLDTIRIAGNNSCAARLTFEDFHHERFLVLNGLELQADPEAGMLVKVIRSR